MVDCLYYKLAVALAGLYSEESNGLRSVSKSRLQRCFKDRKCISRLTDYRNCFRALLGKKKTLTALHSYTSILFSEASENHFPVNLKSKINKINKLPAGLGWPV